MPWRTRNECGVVRWGLDILNCNVERLVSW